MGCVRRIVVVGIIVLHLATFGLTLLVLGSAGVLGDAVVVSANDAVILFFMNIASLAGSLVLSVALWRGGQTRRRTLRDLEAIRASQASANIPPVGERGRVR